jgi:hypothetical protein
MKRIILIIPIVIILSACDSLNNEYTDQYCMDCATTSLVDFDLGEYRFEITYNTRYYILRFALYQKLAPRTYKKIASLNFSIGWVVISFIVICWVAYVVYVFISNKRRMQKPKEKWDSFIVKQNSTIHDNIIKKDNEGDSQDGVSLPEI